MEPVGVSGSRKPSSTQTDSSRQLSTAEIMALPPAIDVRTCARAFGVHPTTMYDYLAREDCPLSVLRIGRKIRIRTVSVWRHLGLAPATPPGKEAAEAS